MVDSLGEEMLGSCMYVSALDSGRERQMDKEWKWKFLRAWVEVSIVGPRLLFRGHTLTVYKSSPI